MKEDNQKTLDDIIDSKDIDNASAAKKNEEEEKKDRYGCTSPLPREYLEYRRGVDLSEGSVRSVAGHLRQLEKFLINNDSSLIEAKSTLIEDYLRECTRDGNRKQTLKGKLSSIVCFYRYVLTRSDETPNSALSKLENINVDRYDTPEKIERGALSDEEVGILFENLNSERDKLMVYLGIVTGLRNAEIRNLKIDDINYEDRTLYIRNPKNGDSYHATMSNKLKLKLKYWINSIRDAIPTAKDSEYVFPSRESEKLECGGTLTNIIKEAAERGGIQEVIGRTKLSEKEQKILDTDKEYREWHKVTPHTLRHTFVTRLHQAGASEEVQRDAANHKNSDTTANYVDPDEEQHHNLVRDFLSKFDDY